jgi:hypothetical protein
MSIVVTAPIAPRMVRHSVGTQRMTAVAGAVTAGVPALTLALLGSDRWVPHWPPPTLDEWTEIQFIYRAVVDITSADLVVKRPDGSTLRLPPPRKAMRCDAIDGPTATRNVRTGQRHLVHRRLPALQRRWHHPPNLGRWQDRSGATRRGHEVADVSPGPGGRPACH